MTVLAEDLMAGVFCNRDEYLPKLQDSLTKFFPDMPLIIIRHNGTITDGYISMINAFEKSGKRFQLWMDDDIIILNPDIIEHAFQLLISQKYAAVIAHMTYKTAALTTPYDASLLVPPLAPRLEKVLMGYFMLVDGWRVKDIKPDVNLPYPNISVETDYGLSIQASGYEFGICADYVYHQNKKDNNTKEQYLETNQYLENKWGQFFKDNVVYDGYLLNLPLTK